MKTIIWKELREHARWIPLGMIPMIIFLVLKWRSNELIFDEYGSSLSLSSLVGLVASGVALCLGILQSWPDQRPAAHALLLHRGITANAAFCGKLLAGLLLYTIAVIVPLLGMAMFIASVGIEHRAASPSALLPAALISIAAFGCWPASLLVVQRDAWFLGSRLMPAVTAAVVVLACGALSTDVFWLACAISLVAIVGLLVAAHRVFVDSGHVATGLGRAGVAVTVTMALMTVMSCVVFVIELYRRAPASSNGGVNYLYAADFGPDGEPWLTRSFYSRLMNGYEVDQVAKMLPGRSVREQLQPVEEGWRQLDKWSIFMMYSARPGRRFASLGNTTVANSSGQAYHLVLDTRLDAVLLYRVGINPRYRLEAKLLPPPPVASFGEANTHMSRFDRAGNFRLVSSTGVYCIPNSGADVELIYAVPSESKHLGGSRGKFGMQANDAPFELLLRHDDRIVLLESDLDSETAARAQSLGEFSGLDEVLRTEVRLPHEVATASMIGFARDPLRADSYLCLTQDPLQHDKSIHWMRFDESGQIKQHELYDNDTQTAEVFGGEWAVGAVPPGVWAIGAALLIIETGRTPPGIARVWELSKSDPSKAAAMLFPFLLLLLLQPMIGIPLVVWAARRRSLDKWSTRQWICWAFWFGPCGSLALLAVYPRILREPCGGCHRATRINLASCEHCGHSLDETPKTGIEIFDRNTNTPTIVTQPAGV